MRTPQNSQNLCIHARIQGFLPGGGGVQARLPENSSDNVFLVLNLFYIGLSMVYFKENYNFTRFQRGSKIFKGGGGYIFQDGRTFSEGLKATLYENP